MVMYFLDRQTWHIIHFQNIISKQQQKIKSFIVSTNNCLNRIFYFFNSLNSEFHLGFWLIDIFSNHIIFVKANHSPNKNKNSYYRKLDKLIFNTLLELYTIMIDIMSLKAELFALKYRINQATQIPSSSHIICYNFKTLELVKGMNLVNTRELNREICT